MATFQPVHDYLPPGKRCAVVFTIDDVHPGRSSEHYDGGGDLGKGALGHVERLLHRHADLHVTLFTTADWREISPAPSRILSRIPVVRDRIYLSRVLPAGSRRVDRNPEFVRYLRSLPRTEIGLHGLHHIHVGRRLHVEFQDELTAVHREKLRRMLAIFDASGLPYVRGMCPPGWNAPDSLLQAMNDLDFDYVASARDIKVPVAAEATTAMSGLRGAPLIFPAHVAGMRMLHFSTNFQATSPYERATSILDAGGILAIKGHIVKDALGHVSLDGIDEVYCNFLDLLFERLKRDYGDSLWWTTMGEVAARVHTQPAERAS